MTTTVSSKPKGFTTRCRLRPTTCFPCIVPARAGERGHFDALTDQTAGRRVFMATGPSPDVGPQGVTDAPPGAIHPPPPEIMIDGLLGRVLARQQAPRCATHLDRQHGMDESAHVGRPWSATRLCGREQGFDIRPVAVGQIRGVELVTHPRSRTAPPTFSDRLLTKTNSVDDSSF